MGRNVEEIKIELNKRGLKDFDKSDINAWALVLAVEDLMKKVC